MSVKKVIPILSLSIFFFVSISFQEIKAQGNKANSKPVKISRPEKWWAISHIFIAKKALKITKESLLVNDSLLVTKTLGHDKHGGQMDAFKHAFWMASLSQNIKAKKVDKLGKAHEKGNYLSYKKGLKQRKLKLPDKASSDMDLWNNDVGIRIGSENKKINSKHLQQIIIQAIQSGEMRIISKDKNGHFLDCKNQVILPASLKGKWENKKCLIPSNNLDY